LQNPNCDIQDLLKNHYLALGTPHLSITMVEMPPLRADWGPLEQALMQLEGNTRRTSISARRLSHRSPTRILLNKSILESIPSPEAVLRNRGTTLLHLRIAVHAMLLSPGVPLAVLCPFGKRQREKSCRTKNIQPLDKMSSPIASITMVATPHS
jgi:hypothetical protein